MVGFGSRIKEKRWEAGMTQKCLADQLGVTSSAVSAYENDTRMPSYEVLVKMAHIFHTTTDRLLGCEAPENSSLLVDASELTYRQRRDVLRMVEVYRHFNGLCAEYERQKGEQERENHP